MAASRNLANRISRRADGVAASSITCRGHRPSEAIALRPTASTSSGGKLSGKTFVLTGTLENLGRNEAKNKVKALGGSTNESVSNRTDYVVIGDNPGAKAVTAEELGVETIDEKEFLRLIGEV